MVLKICTFLTLLIAGVSSVFASDSVSNLPVDNFQGIWFKMGGMLALYIGWVLLDSYFLQRFLNISSFKTAAWRIFMLGFWTFVYLFVPMFLSGAGVGLLIVSKPEIIVSIKSMNSLTTLDGIFTVINQGISGQDLVWALIGLLMNGLMWVGLYYLRCYVYKRHIDASVNYAMLKKAMLYLIIIRILTGLLYGFFVQLVMKSFNFQASM